jgi:hypothetical protein
MMEKRTRSSSSSGAFLVATLAQSQPLASPSPKRLQAFNFPENGRGAGGAQTGERIHAAMFTCGLSRVCCAQAKSYVKKNARGLHALLKREGVPRCPHQAALHAQVSAWLWGQRRRWWCPWYWW